MNKENTVNFIFEVMQMKLNHLYEASNTLDQKISTSLGFTASISAGLMIFFEEKLTLNFNPLTVNFFTAGMFSIFFCISLLIAGLSTKKYHYPPHEDELYSNKSINSSELNLKNQVIADLKKGFVENHKIHEAKARMLNFSLFLLLVGLMLILIDLLYII